MVSRGAERIADSPVCALCRTVMTCIAVLQEDTVSNATFLLRYLEGTQKKMFLHRSGLVPALCHVHQHITGFMSTPLCGCLHGQPGEAFKAGTVVCKLVPIEGDNLVNGWPQKGAGDLMAEAIISQTLSALSQEADVAGRAELSMVLQRPCVL